MKISKVILFVVLALIFIACTPILASSTVAPPTTQVPGTETKFMSATSELTTTPAPTLTSLPKTILLSVPTLDDFYYSSPSPLSFVFIKMLDEVNGWGWVSNYDGAMYRLVRTLDGGISWLDVTPVEKLGVKRDFFLDAETVWIKESSTQRGDFLYSTNNGGKTWELLSIPPNVNSLQFIDATNGFAESSGLCSFTCPITFYKTNNGGHTWTKYREDSPNSFEIVFGSGILFRGTENIWISNYYADPFNYKYLYVTWDGAKTWHIKNMPFKHEEFSDADLDKVNPPVFFGELGYVSAQYSKIVQDQEPKRLIAIFFTQDGGQTWKYRSSVSQTFPSPDYVDFVSPDIAFTECKGGLCITRDGAQTWDIVKLNDAQRTFFDSIDLFDIDFVTEFKGWLLTWKIGVGTNLYFTNDGGNTWIPLPVKLSRGEN